MDSFKELYDNVLRVCRQHPKVSEIGFNRWIKAMEPGKLDGNRVTLFAPNDFMCRTTREIYGDVFEAAFEEILGFRTEVVFAIKEEDPQAKKAPGEFDGIEDIKQRMDDMINRHKRSDYDLTFENFIKGKSNELAYAYCIAVSGKNNVTSQMKKSMFNPLFIYGDSGLGKTHLLKAIENEVRKNHPDLNIIYTTGENFTNELLKAITQQKTAEFHDKYRRCDFLLVDDIQFIAGKEMTQEEFFHTFNELYNAGRQIVLTSDISPNRIRQLEDRIKTRFTLGVQADVQPPDFETRLAIVKRKAELLDLNIPDNVARVVSERIKKNIRQLEGAVNKMKGLTMFSNETPSLSMAQRVIKETLIDSTPNEITIDRILNDVGVAFSVAADDIKSSKRNAQISQARKAAIYVIREVKGTPFNEIARELNRNHSTISISYSDIHEAMEHNADLRDTITDIIKNLRMFE